MVSVTKPSDSQPVSLAGEQRATHRITVSEYYRINRVARDYRALKLGHVRN